MKHIDIIPNYSGITDLITDGTLSPNFLVKSVNDGKVYFSNAIGFKVIVNGEEYNMYEDPSFLAHCYTAEFDSSYGFDFTIVGPDGELTATFHYYATTDGNYSGEQTDSDEISGVTNFEYTWPWGETRWKVFYYDDRNDVIVEGRYELSDEEDCQLVEGEWDPVNCTCTLPEPSCEDQGLCTDGDGNCVECQESCEDQGLCDDGNGNCVECGDDGCNGDIECECNSNGYQWWDGEECHNCEDEWEDLGYSSPEECACDKRGTDSGVCGEEE